MFYKVFSIIREGVDRVVKVGNGFAVLCTLPTSTTLWITVVAVWEEVG
jgi:hypothetical protein